MGSHTPKLDSLLSNRHLSPTIINLANTAEELIVRAEKAESCVAELQVLIGELQDGFSSRMAFVENPG